MENLLFLYSELQEQSVQLSVLGRTLTGTKDALSRYHLFPPKPRLVERSNLRTSRNIKLRTLAVPSDDESDRVVGTVYEIDLSELLLIDGHEIRSDCSRTLVVLDSGREAWAYVGINPHYPRYLTYRTSGKRPSLFKQDFPLPCLSDDEVYYPKNELLNECFSSESEVQKFGAAQFYSFLADTIEVEYCLVIPAIASLRRIPVKIPSQALQDLYKTATDEGFHAEQAHAYLVELADHFRFRNFSGNMPPLFLRRLNDIRTRETEVINREMTTVLSGVVTETRISVELGKFAANKELSESVRKICHSHAQDEFIHSTQFQALGQFLWEEMDESSRKRTADVYVKATIARSLPDIDRLALAFQHSTGRTIQDSYKVVISRYRAEDLIAEMQIAAKPTFAYLRKLGVEGYLSFDEAIQAETRDLDLQLRRISRS